MNFRAIVRLSCIFLGAWLVFAVVSLPGRVGAELPKASATCVWRLPPGSATVDHFEIKVLQLDDSGAAVDSTYYVTPDLGLGPYEYEVELEYRYTYRFRVRSIMAEGEIGAWSGLSSRLTPDATLTDE